MSVFDIDITVFRDPSVKRTVCKKCYSLLIPGVTATTRQRSKFAIKKLSVIKAVICSVSYPALNTQTGFLFLCCPLFLRKKGQ